MLKACIVYRKLSTVGGARIWVLDSSNIIPRGFGSDKGRKKVGASLAT